LDGTIALNPDKETTERHTSDVAKNVGEYSTSRAVAMTAHGANQAVIQTVASAGYLVDGVNWVLGFAGLGSEKPFLGHEHLEEIGTDLYNGYYELFGHTAPVARNETDEAFETGGKVVGFIATTAATLGLGSATLAPKIASMSSQATKAFAPLVTTANKVSELFTSAASGMKGFLLGNPTRGGIMLLGATPTIITTAALATEYHTGGALSEMAIDTAISSIKTLAKSDMFTAENMEVVVDSATYLSNVFGALEKSVQNQVVKVAMKNPENPSMEDIQNGKKAALSFLLLNPENLIAVGIKNKIRTAAIDDLHDDPEEADKYLARKFVQDIIDIAQVRALRGNQIKEEDVINALPETLKSGMLSAAMPKRLQNGLKHLWPNAFTVPPKIPGDTSQISQHFNKARSLLGLTDDHPVSMNNNGNNSFSILNMLKNIPMLGGIIVFLQKVVDFFKPLFGAADAGNLEIQTNKENRAANIIAKSGHTIPPDATVKTQNHKGGIITQQALAPTLPSRHDPKLQLEME